MCLDMGQFDTRRPRKTGQCRHLIEHKGFELVGRQVHVSPAKALQVRKARMRANADAVPGSQTDGDVHDQWITSVVAAGDVSRGDVRHHRLVLP